MFDDRTVTIPAVSSYSDELAQSDRHRSVMLVANGPFGTLEFAVIGSVLPAPKGPQVPSHPQPGGANLASPLRPPNTQSHHWDWKSLSRIPRDCWTSWTEANLQRRDVATPMTPSCRVMTCLHTVRQNGACNLAVEIKRPTRDDRRHLHSMKLKLHALHMAMVSV